jgi:hypothetical protein
LLTSGGLEQWNRNSKGYYWPRKMLHDLEGKKAHAAETEQE